MLALFRSCVLVSICLQVMCAMFDVVASGIDDAQTDGLHRAAVQYRKHLIFVNAIKDTFQY